MRREAEILEQGCAAEDRRGSGMLEESARLAGRSDQTRGAASVEGKRDGSAGMGDAGRRETLCEDLPALRRDSSGCYAVRRGKKMAAEGGANRRELVSRCHQPRYCPRIAIDSSAIQFVSDQTPVDRRGAASRLPCGARRLAAIPSGA